MQILLFCLSALHIPRVTSRTPGNMRTLIRDSAEERKSEKKVDQGHEAKQLTKQVCIPIYSGSLPSRRMLG